MTRLKVAELTSGAGALVLGLGLGSLFPDWLGPAAAVITVTGLVMHAFGMWDKHRIERHEGDRNPIWVVALYWVCWLLLGIVLAIVFLRRS